MLPELKARFTHSIPGQACWWRAPQAILKNRKIIRLHFLLKNRMEHQLKYFFSLPKNTKLRIPVATVASWKGGYEAAGSLIFVLCQQLVSSTIAQLHVLFLNLIEGQNVAVV